MDQLCVSVMGQLLAAYTEVEAMKAANKQREIQGDSLAYNEKDFWDKSQEIHNIYNQLYR